jgi:hypothetical protein
MASTAWWVSSSREAPLLRELVEVGGDDQQLGRDRSRQWQVVLPQRPAGEVSDHETCLRPEQDGCQHLAEAAEEVRGRVGLGALGRIGRRERRRQPLEQRLVGVEPAPRPLAPGHRQHRDRPAADEGLQSREVGHVQVCHPYQLLEAHPLDGVDVGFGLTVGRHPLRQLPRDHPVDRSTAVEESPEVAEERHPLERVHP